MIDKILPRLLNSSSDNRLKKATEMNDALNVVATDNFDQGLGGNDNGDAGVLKPVPSNSLADWKPSGDNQTIESIFPNNPGYTRRTIGSVSDPKAGVVYFFVYSNDTEEQGVYAYDAYDFFGGGAFSWRRIFATSEFQFQDTGRVQGTIVYNMGNADDPEGQEFRPILYFTDDVNEPRKLDVLRCVEQGDTPGAFGGEGVLLVQQKDMITACPKTPLFAPEFQFFNAGDRPISEFRNVRGLQFAIQCKYYTGEITALSTFSDIAVPNEYPSQGLYSGQVQLPQGIRLFIQAEVAGGYNFSEEIEEIRILAREGNTGPFLVIDNIPYNGGDVVEYDYFNDRVLTGITTEEEKKNFDNLPQVAQAIATCENRLFFGNYIEGYDEVPLQATATARYAGNDYNVLDVDMTVLPAVFPRPISFLGDGNTMLSFDLAVDIMHQRSSGISIDTSNVPETVPTNTEISINIVVLPGGAGFSLYDASKSYHGTQLVGGQTATGEQAYTSVDNGQFYSGMGIDVTGGSISLDNGDAIVLSGANVGVGGDMVWRYDLNDVTDSEIQGEVTARYGTSAGAPLRIAAPQDTGDQIAFQVVLRTTQAINNGPASVAAAIGAALSGQSVFMPDGFEVQQSNINPSYSYNLGYQDPTTDEPAATNLLVSEVPSFKIDVLTGVGTADSQDNERARLITPVFNDNENQISGPAVVNEVDSVPCGYFIINEAFVSFKLVYHPSFNASPLGTCNLTLEVDTLTANDIRTCIPICRYDDFKIVQWRVFSGEFIRTHLLTDIVLPAGSENYFNGVQREYLSAHFVAGEADSRWLNSGSQTNRNRTIGWLASNDGTGNADILQEDFFVTNDVRRAGAAEQGGLSDSNYAIIQNGIGVSMIDGEADFLMEELPFQNRGTQMANGESQTSLNTAFGISTTGQQETDALGRNQVLSGMLVRTALIPGNETGGNDLVNLPFTNLNQGINPAGSEDLAGAYNEAFWDFADGIISTSAYAAYPLTRAINDTVNYISSNVPVFGGVDINQTSEAELGFQNIFFQQLDSTGEYRSFKTKAMHDFGVVYYDERGRAGAVNRIPSVYVAGYSNEERNPKGRAYIDIQLNSAPPFWAWYYQIVYAGNNSVQDFVQYTTGGAFINVRQDNTQTAPIYVSLNYLQTNQNVSYSKAWGAMHPDGTPDLYVFTPGDYLRVISYYTDEETIVYPNDLVFEIADQVLLTGSPEDHPLWEGGGTVPDYLQGNFLVLRDNSTAQGFNFSSVSQNNNEPESSTHFWNNRCLVELIKPKKVQDQEERVYYEIGRTYNVGLNAEGVYHQTPTIRITEGDVWWRRVPTNFAPYNGLTGQFTNLIQDSSNAEPDTPESQQYPNFAGVYMESNSFTDTFPEANQLGYGKLHFVVQNPGRVRRYSSVTYSDENDNQTRTLRYTSFNPYNAPFKDLPTEHGAINALVEVEDLFVVQEDKSSILPINKTILSDAAGVDTLIGSEKIIGVQKLIPGSYGADNNRESVLKVDGAVYFANKSKHEVYRFLPGKGVEVISDKGMNSFFVQAFRDVGFNENVRIISGYDPLKDEYIISIIEAEPIVGEVGQSLYERPTLAILPDNYTFDPPEPIEGGTGGGTGGVPDGGPIEDTDGTTFTADLIDPINDGIADLSDEGATAPDGVVPAPAEGDGGDPDAVVPGFPSDGFVVTDTVGPPDPVLEIILFNSEEIQNVADGNSDGFLPYNVRGSYDGLVTEVGDTKVVDLSPILPAHVARTLGSQPLYALNNEQVGTFDAEARTFTVGINSAAYGDPVGFLITGPQESDEGYMQQITENNTIQGFATTFLFSDVISSVRLSDLMEVRTYQLDDYYIERIVEVLKKGYEAQVLGLYDNAVAIFEAAKESAAQSGIDQDPNLAAIISNANAQQQVVDDLLQFQFQRDVEVPYEYFDVERGAGTVGGFGVHTIEKFPLDASDQNNLETLQTAIDVFGQLVAGFLNLDGLDMSTFIESLTASNAALRTQVDILTDQIQELSVSASSQNITLIEGVNTDQLAEDTVAALAQRDGDNILSYADIKREFPDLDALFEGLVDGGVTIDSILVNDILVRYAQLTQTGLGPFSVPAGSPGAPNESIIPFTQKAQNPIPENVDGDIIVGVSDILNVLSLFGAIAEPYGINSEAGVDALINTIVDEFNA